MSNHKLLSALGRVSELIPFTLLLACVLSGYLAVILGVVSLVTGRVLFVVSVVCFLSAGVVMFARARRGRVER